MTAARRPRSPFIAVGLIALAIALSSAFADDYVLYVLSLTCVYVVFAIGYNLLLGCAGQLDFGQAAFLGIGAYTVAITEQRFGLNFALALPCAGLAAALAGLAIGVIVLRLQGFYLALVTLGFSQTVVLLISLSGQVTGGYQGLSVDQPFLLHANSAFELFLITLAVTAVLTGAAVNLMRSRLGLAFLSIRENELAAEAMGINIVGYRVMAYGVSAFYAGIAGGLMAVVLSHITPDGFSVLETIKVLTMVTIGGTGSIVGSILGASILTISGELMQFSNAFYEIGNGILLVLVIMFMPQGVAGLFGAWKRRGLLFWRRARSEPVAP